MSIDIAPDAWAPDGRLIAGTQTVSGAKRRSWNVAVCDTSSGACRVVTEGYSPSWSADGRRLFLLRPPGVPYRELWSIDLDGQNLTAHGSVGPFRLSEVWIDVTAKDEVLYSQLKEGTPEVWIGELTRP